MGKPDFAVDVILEEEEGEETSCRSSGEFLNSMAAPKLELLKPPACDLLLPWDAQN